MVDGSGDPAGSWRSATFREEALGWVRDVLADGGTAVVGELVPHRVRFWSAVFTVRTDRGVFWFKATNPGQGFEGPLLALLGLLVPDHVVVPVAVEVDRGWLLLPDGGPSVAAAGDVGAGEWEALVVQVARMQTALVGHGKELAAAGLPALLPDHAHAYATSLVDSLARLPPSHPQHIGREEARQLLRGLSGVEPLLAELAASGVPPTLQPNDTSAANAVRGGAGYRFLDLGDAFWSHPFAALQVPLRMATGAWPGAPARDDALRARLVSAYLGQWPQVTADADTLVDAADRLASLHRCESWRRLLAPVDPARLGVPTPRLADWIADAARPLDRAPSSAAPSTTRTPSS